MIAEKVQLLGQGCYKDIPDELTLTSMPTSSELDYVGSEDFDATMLDKILPKCVKEPIKFRNLLEIDYQWICRCLRILNYGPYHTTNAILCNHCNTTSHGEYQVDLRTIECKPLPEHFVNDIKISKDEFIEFPNDIHLKLLTIQDRLNYGKDKAFQTSTGEINRIMARICYMITSIGKDEGLTPIQVKLILEKEMSAADFRILRSVVAELTDYGMRAGGTVKCPKCGSLDAGYLALVDDRFFRTTLGDLRQWKHDRSERGDEDVSGSSAEAVRKHS